MIANKNSMKILYVEMSLAGHRANYLRTLANHNDSVCIVPSILDGLNSKQVIIKSGFDKKISIMRYCSFIHEIRQLAYKEKVDVIHVLSGDVFYRFFGLGLRKLAVPTVITFHHMSFEGIKMSSIKRIISSIRCGIVHTDYQYSVLDEHRINNVRKIEYPIFVVGDILEIKEAKHKLNIPKDVFVLSFIGTQRYKGLEVLLEALKYVNRNFLLLITGVERDIKKEDIDRMIRGYADKVRIDLHYLKDEEYHEVLQATDAVVLPYRREFDGASGLMIDGISLGKCIIGSDHGSMGTIIKKHNLGSTFKTGDYKDLAKKVEEAIDGQLSWSAEAEEFRKMIGVERFIKEYRSVYQELV